MRACPFCAEEIQNAAVLRGLKLIAHTDLQTLTKQLGIQARWADKLKALELRMKRLGLSASEQHATISPSPREWDAVHPRDL